MCVLRRHSSTRSLPQSQCIVPHQRWLDSFKASKYIHTLYLISLEIYARVPRAAHPPPPLLPLSRLRISCKPVSTNIALPTALRFVLSLNLYCTAELHPCRAFSVLNSPVSSLFHVDISMVGGCRASASVFRSPGLFPLASLSCLGYVPSVAYVFVCLVFLCVFMSVYDSKLPYVIQHEEEERLSPGAGLTIYGSNVTTLSARIPTDVIKPYTRLPSIYVDFVEHLTSKDVMQTKDLFFLQADCASLYAFVGDIDQGNPQAEWSNLPALVSGFRLLFDCMPVPFLGDGAYAAFEALTSTYKRLSVTPGRNSPLLGVQIHSNNGGLVRVVLSSLHPLSMRVLLSLSVYHMCTRGMYAQ